MSEFDYKIENIKRFSLKAFKFLETKDFENSLQFSRKCSEAICRAIILRHFGENLGKEIIQGEKDKNGSPLPPNTRNGKYQIPLLNKLITIIDGLSRIKRDVITRLHDIKDGGNPASHDPLSKDEEITFENAQFCIESLKRLLEWFFKEYLATVLPNEIQEGFNNKIPEELLVEAEDENWSLLYSSCDFFKGHQNYILISPPSYENINKTQLSLLSKIQWSTIFDFDPKSKSSGLYKAFEDSIMNQEIKPISIEQYGANEIISNTKFLINWVFSNGIEDLPNTIAKNKREWKVNLRYGLFIRKIINELLTKKTKKFVLINFWNDTTFTREIIDAISETSSLNNVKFIFLYEDIQSLPKLKDEFEWLSPIFINTDVSNIIKGIQSSFFIRNELPNSLKHVPARIESNKDGITDLSGNYISILDAEIELLYLGIENDSNRNIEDKPFYQGNTIRWDELSKELDVRREIKESLFEKINSLLEGTKGAYVIELSHKPGAGGTTLSRRIAFDFHRDYPTILINKYHRDKTNEAIFKISDLTQKPILAIIEAHKVTKNDLNVLIRKINLDKKHVVILYVKRTFSRIINENNKSVFISDTLLTTSERDRFVGKYEQITSPQNLKKIQDFNLQVPSNCEVVDFSLSAFEDEYSANSLKAYIGSYMNKLPANQLQFLGFSSLVYYYTQKTLSSELFFKLFPEQNLEEELNIRPLDEHYIRKLLVQSFDLTSLNYTDDWRPRYSRFSKEIIQFLFSEQGNWKDYLSKWVRDLIEHLKSDNIYLTEDIKDLYKSLILTRDHEETLGLDEDYQFAPTKKFSQLIEHIPDLTEKQAIFEKLVESYPEEAHYHGHLGRFLFEYAKEPNDFEKAEKEIFEAIELGDSDFNLWHLKGMCNRRRVEFLIRSYDEINYSDFETIEFEEIIKDLTEIAIDDFNRSRELNSSNLHSYTAQIQLILSVVQFGKLITNTSTEQFLTNNTNFWYEELINLVFELIDEAKYLLELSKDIEYLKERQKANNMVNSSEGKLFSIMGDFSKAVDRFLQLANTADRQIRPYFRKMYVFSILNSKTSNNFRKLNEAWPRLSEYEYDKIINSLEDNIREQPTNTHNIRLWLRALRGYPKTTNIDKVLSVVKTWYDNTINNKISHTEAVYYCYILHACKALSAGDAFNSSDIDETKKYINECKELTLNDRFSFEWFGRGKGIKILVNHSMLGSMSTDSGFFQDISSLKKLSGVISNIYNRQQGKIKFSNGLEAFFVPAKGGFEKGDETKKVEFFISFRYSGLHAWEVTEIGQTKESNTLIKDIEIEGFDELSVSEDDIQNKEIEEKKETVKPETTLFKNTPELEGVKVVGKIDLSQFEKYKKKR